MTSERPHVRIGRIALGILAATVTLAATAAAAPAAPPNDDFADAIVLNGDQATADFDPSTATKQPGEPDHHGDSMGRSVWYRWTPSKSGGAHATLCSLPYGSPYSTYSHRLEVYTGNWGSLVKVPIVGIEACSGAAEARWMASAGTTYWLVADVYENEDPDQIGMARLSLRQDTKFPVTTFKGWPDITGKRPAIQMLTTNVEEPNLVNWECVLDGKPFLNCEPGEQLPDPFNGALASGQHTFKVRATEWSGNVEASWKTRTWTVDATGPATAITSEDHQRVTTAPVLAWAGTEPGQTSECRWSWTPAGDITWFPCTSPLTAPERPLGVHHLRVRGVDAYGNRGTSVAIYWEVVAPVVADADKAGIPDGANTAFAPDTDGDTVVPPAALTRLTARTARKGIDASVTVNRPAKVLVKLQRCATLRKGRCRAWTSRASRTLDVPPGPTTVRLAGGRKLRAGRYRITAQLAGAPSTAKSVRVRVR